MQISALRMQRYGSDANAHTPHGTSVVEEFLKMLESPDKKVCSDSANRLHAAPWVVAPAIIRAISVREEWWVWV